MLRVMFAFLEKAGHAANIFCRDDLKYPASRLRLQMAYSM